MRTALFKELLLLCLLFLLSVVVRWQYVHDSRYTSNDCHVILLSTMEIWGHDGVWAHAGAPVQTYWNEGDKFNHFYKRLESPQGDNYYISYPPFAFLFTYGLLNALGISFSPFPLFILGLCAHFISAVFLWLILRSVFRDAKAIVHMPAVFIGLTCFLFLPASQHLYLHIWFPDVVGQMMLIVSCYFIHRWLRKPIATTKTQEEQLISNSTYLWISILLFFSAYSEWIGLFLGCSVAVVALFIGKDKKLFWSAALGSGAALVLTLAQYAIVAGPFDMLRSLVLRFALRSGYLSKEYSEGGVNVYQAETWETIARNAWNALSVYPFILLIFLLWMISQHTRRQAIIRFVKRHSTLLMLLLLPVFMHVVLLANFTLLHKHAYGKLALPIAIAFAAMTYYFIRVGSKGEQNNNSSIKGYLLSGLTTIVLIIISVQHFHTGAKGGLAKPLLEEVSYFIQKESSPEAAVFFQVKGTDTEVSPFLINYFSKRSTATAKSDMEAAEKAKQIKQQYWEWFLIDEETGERKRITNYSKNRSK